MIEATASLLGRANSVPANFLGRISMQLAVNIEEVELCQTCENVALSLVPSLTIPASPPSAKNDLSSRSDPLSPSNYFSFRSFRLRSIEITTQNPWMRNATREVLVDTLEHINFDPPI